MSGVIEIIKAMKYVRSKDKETPEKQDELPKKKITSPSNFLYKHEVDITDKIKMVIPYISDILNDCDGENNYYTLVSLLVAEPIDFMSQLDDLGVDFTEIDSYELFIMLFGELSSIDTSLMFDDINLSRFKPGIDEATETIALVDEESGAVIDKAVHATIANTLRKIHHMERDTRKPANEEAKKYMIDRARQKLKRSRRNSKKSSSLESLIVSLVNTEQFKYDFEGTKNLTIYQFNECAGQIINKIDYDNRMRGVYAGTISTKDLKPDELVWLKK